MKPVPKTTLFSRPPLERMLRIHQAIQSGKHPNAVSLAGELEVSTKSIHRDLEFMRDRLDLPLEYSAARKGYFYTQEVSGFPDPPDHRRRTLRPARGGKGAAAISRHHL